MSGQTVPFTRLLRNRVPYQLRGYSSSRFLASGMIGGSAEYRWPVWVRHRRASTGLDAYLFTDAGQVFNRREEIAELLESFRALNDANWFVDTIYEREWAAMERLFRGDPDPFLLQGKVQPKCSER